MTKRKSYAISVKKTNDGEICVQWDSGTDDSFVLVTPAQAKQVCEWIMDAAGEIESEQISADDDAGQYDLDVVQQF